MRIKAHIDGPLRNSLTYRHSVTVRGFAVCSSAKRSIVKVCVRDGETTIGTTSSFFERLEAPKRFGRHNSRSSCFEILCSLDPDPAATTLRIDIVAILDNGEERTIGRIPLRLAATDYRRIDYGRLIEPASLNRWKRENIYGSGPPSPVPSLECLDLLKRYVAPGDTVLDVGCGVGAYADGVLAHGASWTGCESAPAQRDVVIARGLRCELVESPVLPFDDRSFKRAICIEVLEHIPEPQAFVAEIARVTALAALFSVPNAELIPLMRPIGVVPWHLLESDHKSFFTRYSLEHMLRSAFAHVEVYPYAPLPIKSVEGLPLPCHLFAIASHT